MAVTNEAQTKIGLSNALAMIVLVARVVNCIVCKATIIELRLDKMLGITDFGKVPLVAFCLRCS